jgi:D-serine deaminase-like pyridoxal phosphate-dependent protein
MTLNEIIRPTFLVDKQICINNIERMAQKAKMANVRFRPHFKTHQSAQIGDWFRDFGVSAITVSSVEMAAYFAKNGWLDITIAFPVNLPEINKINHLSSEINLNLLVENIEAATALKEAITHKTGVYIKIDTGYRRTGLAYSNMESIDKIIFILKKNNSLIFRGFLSHTGHTYTARNHSEIVARLNDALVKLRTLKDFYSNIFPDVEISIGDTPSCSILNQFQDADEIRPGNFVFYDLTMYNLGVCRLKDIAVKLVCPVVARHLERSEMVIYGGAIHLSKDYVVHRKGFKDFGRIVIRKNGESVVLTDDNYVSKISQEHGTLKVMPEYFIDIHVGGLVEIIPAHSCLTAQQARYYLTTDGEMLKTLNS